MSASRPGSSPANALVRLAAAGTIGSLFAAQARLNPAKLAVEDGATQLTYAALHDAAGRAAGVLARLGAVPGERVAILSENRAEYLVLQLACARLGAILACQNWRLTTAELQHCLDLVAPRVIVVSPRHAAKMTGIATAGAATLELGAEWDARACCAPRTMRDAPAAAVSPEDALFILYTSGTTGLPKAAVLSHRAELARMLVMPHDLGVRAGDTNLCWPPLYHMGGTEPALHALLTGGRVIVHEGFDAARIAEVVTRERFGWFSIMPGAVAALTDALEKSNVAPQGVANCGVMPDLVPPHEIARVTALLGAPYCNTFGSTETGTPPLSSGRIPPGVIPDDLAKSPSPGCEIRLVDADDNDVPDGAVGELAMRGPTLFSGYWQNEDANAEDFRGGWFHMGDMFRRRPDGRYDYVDRRKYLIKSGGENILSRARDLQACPATARDRIRAFHQHVSFPSIAAQPGLCTLGSSAPDRKAARAWCFGTKPRKACDVANSHCRSELAGFKQPKEIASSCRSGLPVRPSPRVQRGELEVWVESLRG